ncbi:hypothetical protein [Breoghania sp. L-A4]|uniref:hypothetical protein n=1 Tax=Breoghania sp. L-A4 TaxID=2304600 RepID=UPI000E3605F9|nr:hypothetical protein [Breoghania sp. L-A4]AXS41690.1 hypothetical protein D1F64_18895 [Breoghania sp. L-A4]
MTETKKPARKPASASTGKITVDRVQTGVRIEKRILKVLKAIAEYYDISVGELIEGIVLHSFEGDCAFDEGAVKRITQLKAIYDLDLDSTAAHRLTDTSD